MRKQRKKYHYLYRTTNMINGKYYVGIHSTYKIKDGYLGSGTRLWNAIYKYGKENFVKEELEFFENREELLQREKEIVNEQLLQDPLCMNLMLGGYGGWTKKHQIENGKRGNARMKILRETDLKWIENFKTKISISQLETYSNGRIPVLPNWNGRKHNEETKLKIGIANSIKQTGENNSQYGTCWIKKEKEVKKVKKENLQQFLNEGWILGRK